MSGDDGPGLAKLDADFIKDSTSVEDKVEAVAAAIKRREDNPAEAQQVCCKSSDAGNQLC